MIDTKKLYEFLKNRHAEANTRFTGAGGGECFYQLGQAHATAEIITKLDSGEFDIKNEGEETEAYIQTLEEEMSKNE